MTVKTFLCKTCGLKFRLTLTEREWEAGSIPCPGCAETDLAEIDEAADLSMLSQGASYGEECLGCPSFAQCHGTDIENTIQAR